MSVDASSLPERHYLDIGISLKSIQRTSRTGAACRVCFRLHMCNTGGSSIQLLGRKWILRDSSGETRIIEANHVFNQTPVLAPGAVFSYGGCHDFRGVPRLMEVRFFGKDQNASPFITPPVAFTFPPRFRQ